MKTLVDRYRLEYAIGAGGMGIVWRARDLRDERLLAIKEVRPPEALPEAERVARVERAVAAARAAAGVAHPGVVPVREVVLDAGQPWIVMDFVDGRSLDERVRADGALGPAETAALGLSLLDALRAAHAAGVVHGDVKPANVLTDADGRNLLTDFALAATLGGGVPLGGPAYIAPERQRTGDGGPAADLYSLGATLRFAVTAGDPGEGEGPDGPLGAAIEALLSPDPRERLGPFAATAALLAVTGREPDPELAARIAEESAATPVVGDKSEMSVAARETGAPDQSGIQQESEMSVPAPAARTEGNATATQADSAADPGSATARGAAAAAGTAGTDGAADPSSTAELGMTEPGSATEPGASPAEAGGAADPAEGTARPSGAATELDGAEATAELAMPPAPRPPRAAAAAPSAGRTRISTQYKVAAVVGAGILAFLVVIGSFDNGGAMQQDAQAAAGPTTTATRSAKPSPLRTPSPTEASEAGAAASSSAVVVAPTTGRPAKTRTTTSAPPKPTGVSADVGLNPSRYTGPCGTPDMIGIEITVTVHTNQPSADIAYTLSGFGGQTGTASNGAYSRTYALNIENVRRGSATIALNVTGPGAAAASAVFTNACVPQA